MATCAFSDYATFPSGAVCPGAEFNVLYTASADVGNAVEAVADVHGLVAVSLTTPTGSGKCLISCVDPSSGEVLFSGRFLPTASTTTFALMKAAAA